MRLQRNELIAIAVLIGYIAFFTHPPPSHITNLLESPVGHAIFLLGILYIVAYQSLIVGIFLAIAYIMTSSNIIEHLTTFDSYKDTPDNPDVGTFQAEDPRSLSKINDQRSKQGLDPLKSKPEEKTPNLSLMFGDTGKNAKQTPPVQKKQPTSSCVPAPSTVGVVGAAIKSKGSDTQLPPTQFNTKRTKIAPFEPTKGVKEDPKPAAGLSNKTKESFGNFAAF
jgi:hypothetical protein